jgi:hypothetical protein
LFYLLEKTISCTSNDSLPIIRRTEAKSISNYFQCLPSCSTNHDPYMLSTDTKRIMLTKCANCTPNKSITDGKQVAKEGEAVASLINHHKLGKLQKLILGLFLLKYCWVDSKMHNCFRYPFSFIKIISLTRIVFLVKGYSFSYAEMVLKIDLSNNAIIFFLGQKDLQLLLL